MAFLRRVLAVAGAASRVIVTDKLASYLPAVKRVLPTTEHRRHKRLNNRAENSHVPVRKRERILQRFKSAEHAQTFLEPSGAVCNRFRRVATACLPTATARSCAIASAPGRRWSA